MNITKGTTRNLFNQKFKLMNLLLAIDLVILVAIISILFFTNIENLNWLFKENMFFKTIQDQFGAISSLTIPISFCLLSFKNEKIFVSNNYRLIPISEKSLYFKNMLTSFISEVYLMSVISIINILLAIPFMPNSKLELTDPRVSTLQSFLILCGLLIAFIFGMLVIWSVVTFFHFLLNVVSDFLPFKGLKFVRVIINIIIIWLITYVFVYFSINVVDTFYRPISFNVNMFAETIWLFAGIFVIGFFIAMLINTYFLKRWVETKY